MSRFKEKNRIDAAIAHRNIEELEWALSYSKMRLQAATLKDHDKSWRKTIKAIEAAIEQD